MTTTIRLAGRADRATLAMLRRLWTEERDGAATDDAFEARFGDWFETEAGRRRFWLAERSTRPVGMVYLVIFERMPRPGRAGGRWGHVGNMYVAPEHRNAGIGALLA